MATSSLDAPKVWLICASVDELLAMSRSRRNVKAIVSAADKLAVLRLLLFSAYSSRVVKTLKLVPSAENTSLAQLETQSAELTLVTPTLPMLNCVVSMPDLLEKFAPDVFPADMFAPDSAANRRADMVAFPLAALPLGAEAIASPASLDVPLPDEGACTAESLPDETPPENDTNNIARF